MIGAMEYMNKAVSAAPEHAEAYIARSQLYLKMYQYDNAIEDLKNVMRINTNDYLELYLEIAKALSMKGENAKTVTLLEECIKVDPTNFGLYLEIADLQMSQYKREDALESVNSYIDIVPDDSYAYYLRANIHRDQALIKEDINMAINLCKESGKTVPKEYYNLLSTTN
jgi:tetratricopeptide (TPR) repeat protein